MKFCSLSDFREDAINMAMFKFREGSRATSLNMHPTEKNTMTIHYRPGSKIGNAQQAFNMAKGYEKRVKNWAKTTWGEKYENGWIRIENSRDNTHVKVVFEVPQFLMKAQEVVRLKDQEKQKALAKFKREAARLIYEDKVRSGDFYEEDGIIFKQISPSNKSHIDKKLEDKLVTFLNKYGISVEFVNSLKERGFNAVAISDIVNKLVLISKNEAGADTLPEEAAHFAVELLGMNNPLVKRMMDIIEGTEVYQKVLDEYSTDPDYLVDGKLNTEKLKKEAIGKAIGDSILAGKNLTQNKGILGTLKRLWDKALSFFRKVDVKTLNEELTQLTSQVASSILDDTFKGDINNLKDSKESIFKSKQSKERVSREVARALQAIKTLETRIKQIKNKGGDFEIGGLQATIRKIQYSIDANESLVGIDAYLNSVSESAVQIDDKIKKYIEDSRSFLNDVGQLKHIHDFVTLHTSMANSIYEMFNEDPMLRERGEHLLKHTEEIITILNRAKSFVNANMREATKDTIYKYAENKELAETIFDMGEKDISGISTYINTAKNSKNEVLRIVDSILRNIKASVNRFTLNKGKEIIKAQIKAEESGFKDFGKLAERTKDGKLSGNIIREVNYGEWNIQHNKIKSQISEMVGKPFHEIFQLGGDTNRVAIDMWRNFHKENSIKNKEGKYIPNAKYKNPVFTEVMSNPAVKEYYDLLIKNKKESSNKLPKNYQTDDFYYRLPQIRKNTLQRIRSEEGSLWSNFKNTVKEDFRESFKVREDETEFGHNSGEVTINPVTGEEIKFLPIYFNNKLNNMADVSLDFSATYIAYTHMAETYSQRQAKQGEIWLIEDAINNKVVVGSRAANKGASNLKKALANIVDTHFYGKTKHMETFTYKGVVTGKTREVNVTKVLDRFLAYVRNNNLAFSPFTHLTNHIMGSAYSKLEDIAGRYSTNTSKMRAEVEFDRNMMHITSEIGKRLKTNKINLLLEYNNIIHDGSKMFRNLDIKSNVGRALTNSGLLSTYELSDTRVKGKMLISIYDNYRLFDGKFINFKEFKTLNKSLSKSELNAKWKELSDKTLYDAYEAKDGVLSIKPEFEDFIGEDLINKLTGTLDHVLNTIDGQLSESDKTELHRYVVGRAILTHRNWMITGLEDRFKSQKYSYVTHENEEGFYRTFGRVFISGFKKDAEGNLDRAHLINTMKSLVLAGKDLNEDDKANIKKVWADMTFVMLAIVVAAILNGIADDEPDSYLAQFGGYLSTRVKLEATALAPTPQAVFQSLDILSSPAAGINQFESIVDGLYMLTLEGTAFDEVRSGGYKGMTKLEQLMIKRSILKPFYETANIEAIKGKNRFIKQMGL